MEVVAHPTQRVEHQIVLAPVGQQPHDLVIAALAEQLDRLRQRHAFLADALVGRGDLAHARLDGCQLLRRERRPILHLAEVAAEGDRMIHAQPGGGEKLPDRDHHEEGERAAIDAAAVAIVGAQRRHLDISLDVIGQLAQLVVDQRGDDREGPGPLASRGDDVFLQRRPDRRFVDAAVGERHLGRGARLGRADLAG